MKSELSFSSFNLYNLNVPGLPIYTNDGWNSDQYNLKVEWAADLIKTIHTDVIAFQELWHEQALVDVFKKAGLFEEYNLHIPEDHSGQKIVCAAAVRKGLTIGDPSWIVNFPEKFKLESKGDDPQTPKIAVNIDKFSRPVLKLNVQPRTDQKEITVFIGHLKSKGPTKIYKEDWYNADKNYYKKYVSDLGSAISTIRRTSEAAALRMMIIDELKGTDKPLVVIGDLNDSQLSNTLNVISGQPSYLHGLSTGGGDADLYSVATLQEYRSMRDVYYTHVHQNVRESLDHILVSQEFYDNSKKRIWAFNGMQIFNDHLNEHDHKENGSTDHGIVKASFKYNPA